MTNHTYLSNVVRIKTGDRILLKDRTKYRMNLILSVSGEKNLLLFGMFTWNLKSYHKT